MRYTLTARWLHWLIALGVFAVITLGIVIAYFEPADEAVKMRVYNIHESLGFTIGVLMILRLLWRWGHPPPPLPASLSPALVGVAHATHFLLYVLLIIQPIVGLAASNAWGFPLVAFDLIPIPVILGANEPLAGTLSTVHFGIACALGVLLLAHIAGALMHHFVWKDDTLRRMV